MDFRRIEMIFLVVFIALDVFLFTSFSQAQSVVVSSSKADETSIAAEMKNSNITTEKLSSKDKKGYYLAGKSDQGMEQRIETLKDQKANVSNNVVTSVLNNPINVKGKDTVEVLENFVATPGNVLFEKSYRYNEILSNSTNYVFSQKIQYGQLYDDAAQITFYKKGNQITSYRQTYTKKTSVLREEQDAISQKDAVNYLYTASEIPDNSKISDAKLNYGRLLTAKGSAIYIPIWYIQIENKNTNAKTVKLVNAFNGTIIKNQQKEDIQ
ncbi:hypothetical protein RD055328_12570 [Companilactobacillus sp. RD055328]|uniref:two-component system regulatory protein YycI n=1 Tax=Companilactobacillus sp. RD055328 TaxID=2916634 RepID=UPI001FC894EC|nr:two-component system regulatory protein YycI [Companilactobacillus sp. RD055328]GKQ43334.1 hypothetical protein RD055328_12570 [Companilactobacillus sp. RD055328]